MQRWINSQIASNGGTIMSNFWLRGFLYKKIRRLEMNLTSHPQEDTESHLKPLSMSAIRLSILFCLRMLKEHTMGNRSLFQQFLCLSN